MACAPLHWGWPTSFGQNEWNEKNKKLKELKVWCRNAGSKLKWCDYSGSKFTFTLYFNQLPLLMWTIWSKRHNHAFNGIELSILGLKYFIFAIILRVVQWFWQCSHPFLCRLRWLFEFSLVILQRDSLNTILKSLLVCMNFLFLIILLLLFRGKKKAYKMQQVSLIKEN